MPELLTIAIELPVEVWRALVKLALGRKRQPNVVIVEAIEEKITRAARKR